MNSQYANYNCDEMIRFVFSKTSKGLNGLIAVEKSRYWEVAQELISQLLGVSS